MPYRSSVNIAVNGQQQSLEVDHRTTLLEVLRDHLDLTGAKRACDRGECGACTVLLDGQPVYACHLLAMQVRGRAVRTIEGLETSMRKSFFAPMYRRWSTRSSEASERNWQS